MFEDSLVESQSRIRTRSRWCAIGSFFAQAAILLLLILFPLFHPEALPRQSLERLLTAPPPPRAPAHIETRAAAPAHPATLSLQAQLQAPRSIPDRISTTPDIGPPPGSSIGDISPGGATGIPAGIDLGSPVPAITVTHQPAPKGPVKISTGVSTGLLLNQIRPIYPAIAKAARIQGVVVVEATISRQGTIENLRVMEGPLMLRQSAIDAVSQARYRPFLLNGEPVEVETVVRVVFSLGD